MRHFRSSPLAIAALAFGMGAAATAAVLVAPPGGVGGLTAGGLGARPAAIDLAPVAVAAEHHLAVTPGTIEQTRAAQHRRLPPLSAGPQPALA